MKKIFYIFIIGILITIFNSNPAKAMYFTADPLRGLIAVEEVVGQIGAIARSVQRGISLAKKVQTVGSAIEQGQYLNALKQVNSLNNSLVRTQTSFYSSMGFDYVKDGETVGSDEGLFSSDKNNSNTSATSSAKAYTPTINEDYTNRSVQVESIKKDRTSYLVDIEKNFFITEPKYTNAQADAVKNSRIEAHKDAAITALVLADQTLQNINVKLEEGGGVPYGQAQNIRQQVIEGTSVSLGRLSDVAEQYTLELSYFYMKIFGSIVKAPLELLPEEK